MSHTLFLAPIGSSVGLTSVALGLLRALDSRGVRVGFFKPIGQLYGRGTTLERSTHFVRMTTALEPTLPMPLDEAERLIVSHRSDELMSRVVADFHRCARDADLVVVEGLVHTPDTPLEVELNARLIETLSAELILVGALGNSGAAAFAERARLAAEQYSGGRFERVLGVIANRVPGPDQPMRLELEQALSRAGARGPGLRLLGAVPDNPELGACRTVDVMRHLGAEVLNEGELATRRVKRFTLLARTVPNLIHTLAPGSVLVTPCDRSDVVLLVAMGVMNAIPIAGLVVTGERAELPSGILKLCAPAFATGLPVLRVPTTS